MLKTSALLATAIFILCDSAVIEKDKRCDATDEACLTSLFKIIVNAVADNGIAEAGIPKIDPLKIKDMNFDIYGMVNITLIDGTVTGFKSCYSTAYENNLDTGIAKIEVICDRLGIEGSYIAESTPALLALTGGINIHGKGTGNANIEKTKVNVDIAFEVRKHDDGEVYYDVKPEKSSYTIDVMGPIKVDGNNLFVGNQDISAVSVNIINENGKVFIKNFGKIIFDKVFDLKLNYFAKFFYYVPAKDLTTNDLSSYIR